MVLYKTGGSHGGEGGSSNCNGCTYGSTTYPTDLGTGTSDSPGGGSVRLKVAGSLFLDGSITADGASDSGSGGSGGGGGSGGSILVEADAVSGHGIMTARGGWGM